MSMLRLQLCPETTSVRDLHRPSKRIDAHNLVLVANGPYTILCKSTFNPMRHTTQSKSRLVEALWTMVA